MLGVELACEGSALPLSYPPIELKTTLNSLRLSSTGNASNFGLRRQIEFACTREIVAASSIYFQKELQDLVLGYGCGVRRHIHRVPGGIEGYLFQVFLWNAEGFQANRNI